MKPIRGPAIAAARAAALYTGPKRLPVAAGRSSLLNLAMPLLTFVKSFWALIRSPNRDIPFNWFSSCFGVIKAFCGWPVRAGADTMADGLRVGAVTVTRVAEAGAALVGTRRAGAETVTRPGAAFAFGALRGGGAIFADEQQKRGPV